MSGDAADGDWSAAMAKWSALIEAGGVCEYDIEHEEPVMIEWGGRRRCSACGVELVPLRLVCAARARVGR